MDGADCMRHGKVLTHVKPGFRSLKMIGLDVRPGAPLFKAGREGGKEAVQEGFYPDAAGCRPGVPLSCSWKSRTLPEVIRTD
jgi:hypothetical protein